MKDRHDENPRQAAIRRTIRQYIRVSHLHHSAVEGRVSRLGIHHSQHRMLMHLARYEHIPAQRELAEEMGITPAAATTTLKRLEKAGYIARTAGDGDNRRREIRITEKGLLQVEASRDMFDAIDRATFEGLSDAEIETLSTLLGRMQDNLLRADAPTDLQKEVLE